MGGSSGTDDDTLVRPDGPRADPGAPEGVHPAAVAATSGPLPAGARVGEYQVDAPLGEGGMGTVYAAHHPIIGKRVAIKVLRPALSGEAALVRRFVDEARAVNKIGHPNIIDIFAFGQLPDGRHYFVMELLEGQTLAAWMLAGATPTAEVGRFLGQTLDALAAAHRERIVHRDLKPENLWIARPRHGEPFVKVLDFGIAKLLEKDPLHATHTGVAMGTPFYMSPEQCLGQDVDHRTDLYAMGVILYQLFTGRLPFEGRAFAEVVTQQITEPPSAPSRWRSINPALEALILRCLEKDPARRPQMAESLRRELDAALAERLATPLGATVPAAAAPAVVGAGRATTLGDFATTQGPKTGARPGIRWGRWLAAGVAAVTVVAGLAILGLRVRAVPAPEASAVRRASDPESSPSPSPPTPPVRAALPATPPPDAAAGPVPAAPPDSQSKKVVRGGAPPSRKKTERDRVNPFVGQPKR